MIKSKLTAEQETSLKAEEGYAILTQGIQVTLYDYKRPYIDQSKQSQHSTDTKYILWLEMDLVRLCIGKERVSIVGIKNGTIPAGIYIRDIASIDVGCSSYDFITCRHKPLSADYCLSITSSERTISIELPSTFIRDWFVIRFQCIANDVLSSDERDERLSWMLIRNRKLLVTEEHDCRVLLNVLHRGIQVLHHHTTGHVYSSILTYDDKNSSLVVTPIETTFLGLLRVAGPTVFNLKYASAVRLGTHSYMYIKTKCSSRWRECLTLISTEKTLDLQLANESTRNIFAAKLRMFIYYVQSGAITARPSVLDDIV